MKLICFLFVFILWINGFSQSPQAFKYQAIVRNNVGIVISNQLVSLRISLLKGNTSGTLVYSEKHSVTTGIYGLVNLEIGNGIGLTGIFGNIDWSNGPYFIKIELDITGGTNYSEMGTSQLLSVPYALFAASGNAGPQGPSGVAGPQGAAGLNGVGIVNTYIQNDILYILLSDGNTLNAGYVKGAQGLQGTQGLQGIQGLQGNNGIDGNDGVGITNTYILNDSLFIILSDGNVINSGNVKGVQGLQGSQGIQGLIGPQGVQGPAGIGLNNKGAWVSGTVYSESDYVFDRSTLDANINTMWICQSNSSFTSFINPYQDNANWVEFQAPSGQNGISVEWLGTLTTAPSNPLLNQAYYNSNDNKSYIWNGANWNIIAQDGITGPQGIQGLQGIQGFQGNNGDNGNDGVGITNTYIYNDSLFVIFSNGNSLNAGYTKGAQGLQGIQGNQGLQGNNGTDGINGVSIIDTYIQNDSLFVIFSDGNTINTGYVKGEQGLQGIQGSAGVGLNNRGLWASGTVYSESDYVFDRSTLDANINSMWICQSNSSFTSFINPYLDNANWVEFQAPSGQNGISVEWLGLLTTAPSNPLLNQAYYNSNDKKSYIWNGANWNIIAQDGIDGEIGPIGIGIDSAKIMNDSLYIRLTSGDTINTGYTKGSQGIQGLQGIQGEIGPQGIQGEVGPQGLAGVDGINGADGVQGIQGEIGPQGSAGIDGVNGAGGIQGETGPQGIQGDTGPQGPAGIDGVNGADGILGIQGEIGPQGPAGINGINGADGVQGIQGEVGPQGIQGIPGSTGTYSAGNGLSLNGSTFNSTWTTSGNEIFNNNTGFVGIGTNNPTSTLHINGSLRITNSFEGNNKILTSDLFGNASWQNPSIEAYNGSPNYIPKFVNSSSLDNSVIYQNGNKLGVGTTTPTSRVQINADPVASDTDPIFEIKDKFGRRVMVVYNDSIHFFVSDPLNNSKANNKGSFAVSGKSTAKGVNYPFFEINFDSTAIVNPSQNRVLWYPARNAFRTGRVLINHKDSVGINSFASGFESQAKGSYSQALGYHCYAWGDYSTAIGKDAKAMNVNSFAFGDGANAKNDDAYAFGAGAIASGLGSFAFGSEGRDMYGSPTGSFANASGSNSFALGFGTLASGEGSFSLGNNNISSGSNSFAAGFDCRAEGDYSLAIGSSTIMSMWNHITKATSQLSMALGFGSVSSNLYSIAIGVSDTASGANAIALGMNASARAVSSVAIGKSSVAQSYYSTTVGSYNQIYGDQFNWVSSDPVFVVGNGQNDFSRSNAMTILKNGNVGIATISPNATLEVGTGEVRFPGAGGGFTHFNYLGDSKNYIRGTTIIADEGGNVGIGTSTPATKLDVAGNISLNDNNLLLRTGTDFSHGIKYSASFAGYTVNGPVIFGYDGGALGSVSPDHIALQWTWDNKVGINKNPVANNLEVEGEASKTIAGSWLANSDKRIKTDIKNIENSFETILKLRPVIFKYSEEWKKLHPTIEDKFYYNFIAQEYQQVFPDAVRGSGEYLNGDQKEILQIDTYNAQIVTIKAVQELILQNRNLSNDVDKLKKENAELKLKNLEIDKLKSEIDDIKIFLGTTKK